MPEVFTVRTSTLEIGYETHGRIDGFPIVLLHGFPDDARAWDAVAPPLAAAGHRVLVPYLRGYGSTHFLDPAEPRMAQQAAIAQWRSSFSPYHSGHAVHASIARPFARFVATSACHGSGGRGGDGGTSGISQPCGVRNCSVPSASRSTW